MKQLRGVFRSQESGVSSTGVAIGVCMRSTPHTQARCSVYPRCAKVSGSWFSVLVLLFLCSLVSHVAAAAPPHTLTVTLRDVRGVGIAGATITVRDEAGSIDLAHTTTDSQGTATLPNLTAEIVRVAASGTLVDGTPLSQRGQDARGIWLLLDAPLVQLDLRSELNGAIIPNPTTMISNDVPIPATPDAPTSIITSMMTEAPSSAVIVPTTAVGGVPTAIPFDTTQSNVNARHPAALNRWLVLVGTLILVLAFWFVWGRRASR